MTFRLLRHTDTQSLNWSILALLSSAITIDDVTLRRSRFKGRMSAILKVTCHIKPPKRAIRFKMTWELEVKRDFNPNLNLAFGWCFFLSQENPKGVSLKRKHGSTSPLATTYFRDIEYKCIHACHTVFNAVKTKYSRKWIFLIQGLWNKFEDKIVRSTKCEILYKRVFYFIFLIYKTERRGFGSPFLVVRNF